MSKLGSALFLVVATLIPSLRADDGWPCVRGDAALTGVARGNIRLPLRQAWTFKLARRHDEYAPTPVLDAARAYVGDAEGHFSAIDVATGRKVWEYTIIDPKKNAPSGDPIDGSACLAGDKVIFGAADGIVRALTVADGKEVWKYESRSEIKAGLTPFTLKTGGASRLCVIAPDFGGQITCLEVEGGKEVWKTDAASPVNAAASVGPDGIVVGGCNGSVEVFDPATGKATSTPMDVGHPMPNSVAQGGGWGFLAHAGNRIEAWELKTSTRRWEFRERDFPYFTSPALTAAHVLVGGKDKRLHCLNRAKGDEAWAFKARNEIAGSPVVAGGLVVFGSDDGRLYVADMADGSEKWSFEIGAPVRSAPAVAGGRVIVVAMDGVVYGFESAK